MQSDRLNFTMYTVNIQFFFFFFNIFFTCLIYISKQTSQFARAMFVISTICFLSFLTLKFVRCVDMPEMFSMPSSSKL